MITAPSSKKQPLSSRVRDYMTAEPLTLGVEHSLLDAVLMLRRASVRHIPILGDGRLVGVLSDRDVARVTPFLLTHLGKDEYNRVFEDTPVEKVMTKDPITTSPDTPLLEAVDLLYTNRLGCLPVLDHDKLVGIITVIDMLRAMRDLMTEAAPPSNSPPSAPHT